MQDIEIESVLNDAGYRFMTASGRYQEVDGADEDVDYPTQDIADQLAIPVEDLIRWEQEQITDTQHPAAG
jgi:hypothetical protein